MACRSRASSSSTRDESISMYGKHLRVFVIVNCLVMASADRSEQRYADLSHDNVKLKLATEDDLLREKNILEGRLSKVEQGLEKAVKDARALAEQDLVKVVQKAKETIQSLLDDTTARTALLQKQEQRLYVATQHGIYGKCCCNDQADAASGKEKPTCTWTEVEHLSRSVNMNCLGGGMEYMDFAKLDGKTPATEIDELLDQCVTSSPWRRRMEDREVVKSEPESNVMLKLEALGKTVLSTSATVAVPASSGKVDVLSAEREDDETSQPVVETVNPTQGDSTRDVDAQDNAESGFTEQQHEDAQDEENKPDQQEQKDS